MGRGELSSLLLELAGLQGPQIVRYLLGDRNAKVNCVLGDFEVVNGDMRTKTAVIDTELNVVDITGDALDKKIAAMEAYATEIREFPHPRSGKYLRALATVRGAQVGMIEAEAFELVYKKSL